MSTSTGKTNTKIIYQGKTTVFFCFAKKYPFYLVLLVNLVQRGPDPPPAVGLEQPGEGHLVLSLLGGGEHALGLVHRPAEGGRVGPGKTVAAIRTHSPQKVKAVSSGKVAKLRV